MTHTSFMAAIVASAFALTATSTLASGDHAGRQGPKISFQELDADGDGQITQEEMSVIADKRFSKSDTDGDGKLSRAELEAQGQKRVKDRVARMMERFDKDGDESLSPDEMPGPKRAGMMFDKFDQDKSGGISEDEFEEARSEMRGKWKMRGSMDDHDSPDDQG